MLESRASRHTTWHKAVIDMIELLKSFLIGPKWPLNVAFSQESGRSGLIAVAPPAISKHPRFWASPAPVILFETLPQMTTDSHAQDAVCIMIAYDRTILDGSVPITGKEVGGITALTNWDDMAAAIAVRVERWLATGELITGGAHRFRKGNIAQACENSLLCPDELAT